MKRSKLLVLALVAVLMIVGLAIVACSPNCDGDGMCNVVDGEGSACTTSGCEATAAWAAGVASNTGGYAIKASGKCTC
jgi:hypothetical protein